MRNSFENKTVLVSGAGKGIGKQIALTFAREGTAVAFFARDIERVNKVDQEIKRIGGKVFASTCDITNTEHVGEFLQNVKLKLGKIDILINNVGVGLVKNFFQTSEADFDLVFSTNLKGPFFLTQKVAREMKSGSSIIFITSIHAEHPSLDPTYDGSKAAINSLVANLALELAPQGIRVNAVAPGAVMTPGVEDMMVQRLAMVPGISREDLLMAFKTRVPLNRTGEPDDIAKVVLFLSSNAANYMTGSIVVVDGGYLQS